MICRICGSTAAKIRDGELDTAYASKRAHVDCAGHSEYRAVRPIDIEEERAKRGKNADFKDTVIVETPDAGVVSIEIVSQDYGETSASAHMNVADALTLAEMIISAAKKATGRRDDQNV